MVYIANSIQWVIAFLGIQKIGAVVVPVSPIYTSHEIAYMIQDSGAETVICMDTNYRLRQGSVRPKPASSG
ncbi:MAG: AMP-binding protein [Desulfomicrobium escambiense]|nr:AMP-binding protein [Desulfomicrobium escambiense]